MATTTTTIIIIVIKIIFLSACFVQSESRKSVVIQALDDAVLEGEEKFTVQLLSARNEPVIDPTRSECLDYFLEFLCLHNQESSL